MKRKYMKTFWIWMALLNWPPVLIWIPFFRLPCFLGFLLWINVPVQRFGLAKLMGGHHYRIEGYGAMPQTPLSWILITAFWLIVAIGLTGLTAIVSAMRKNTRKDKEAASNHTSESIRR